MKYIMLLQIKETNDSEKEYKAVKLPECEDTDTTYLYKVLSHFALNGWVNLCGVVPGLDCGCLSEEDKKFWEAKLVDYEEIIKEK